MITQGKFFTCFACLLAICGAAYAAYAPSATSNPRANDSAAVPRFSSEIVARRATVSGATRVRTSPSRAGIVSRGALINSAVRTAAVPSTRTRTRIATAPATVSRVARSAKTNARAGKSTILDTSNISRSATVRATALFNDVSKIGSGYANCRESYATCMDQICGQANDTYRRCFCSDRFNQFRDIENALDKAMIMLQQFQDNNLNAVDKTAAEVNAMYSATVGEQAIKKDTSASAKMLEEINDLLSGKSSSKTTSGSNSIGVLDLDFSSDMDDIWSGGSDSIFSSSGQDLSQLEGAALFGAAQKQCSRLSQGTCENDAVFSMSKSSYNILISQDCNAYEKTVNKKRETVAQAIRTAEKYLREARLEEYRSHNSADVNECIAKVRTAMLQDTACGEDYKRCLDPTGAYINGATGEAIYTPRLFELEKTIDLGGVDAMGQDIISQNPDYNKFLENYRKYVTRELDTCRDIADFVWTEFKRNAIIEIAQAQTNKIEEVKMSCVNTMAECYNTQTQALVGFDQNTATAAGALGRYAAHDMCREKVVACAALYGNNTGEGCEFDARGHLTSSDAECGLKSLLAYVQTVDSLNVVEKCNEAIDEYVEQLCTPDGGTYEYPYKCKGMSPVDSDNNMSLPHVIKEYALSNCWDVSSKEDKTYANLDVKIRTRIDTLIADVRSGVRATLAEICEESDGHWYNSDSEGRVQSPAFETPPRLTVFYNEVSGRGTDDPTLAEWGVCYQNTRMLQCLGHNTDDGKADEDGTSTTNYATWDATREVCTFTDSWYKKMCEQIGGYYENETCYIGN